MLQVTTQTKKIWTRADVISLASPECGFCYGLGFKRGPGGITTEKPCNCVLRKVFRLCLERFRRATDGSVQGRVLLDSNGQFVEHSMTNEEYASDFLTVSKRTLGETTLEYKIFKYHILYGADYKLVTRKLGLTIERKAFFDEVYKIMHRLGKVFRELEPYALFPTDEYFSKGCRNRMETAGGVQ